MSQAPPIRTSSVSTDTALKESDHGPILEQMDRILESPLFKHSKRYSMVLKYLVDRALQESPDGVLKERTIGVEVLGRAPDYDTNVDPTVRVVASEIRKRLSVFYDKSGREGGVCIDLPTGSYTPQFKIQSWPSRLANGNPAAALHHRPHVQHAGNRGSGELGAVSERFFLQREA